MYALIQPCTHPPTNPSPAPPASCTVPGPGADPRLWGADPGPARQQRPVPAEQAEAAGEGGWEPGKGGAPRPSRGSRLPAGRGRVARLGSAPLGGSRHRLLLHPPPPPPPPSPPLPPAPALARGSGCTSVPPLAPAAPLLAGQRPAPRCPRSSAR